MSEADRLGRLINDLLDLAKIEAGRVEWNFEPIRDPVDLVAHVVPTFKPLASESNADLSHAGCAGTPRRLQPCRWARPPGRPPGPGPSQWRS